MASPARKQSEHVDISNETRAKNVRYVLDSMRLEGVTLDQQSLDNLNDYQQGKLTDAEFIKRGLEIVHAIEKKNKK